MNFSTAVCRRSIHTIALLLVMTVIPGAFAAAQWEAGGLEDVAIINIRQKSDGLLYAATDEGIYQSTDDGLTWSMSEFNEPYSIIVIGPTGVMLLYNGTELLKSEDNGDSWTALSLPAPVDRIWNRHIGPDGTFILTTTGDVFYSWDRGETWARGNTGLPSIPDVSTIINTADNRMLCGTGGLTGGGVFASSDGSSWTSLHWAGVNFDIEALGAAEDVMLVGIYDKGVLRSVDNGATWTPVTSFSASASGFLLVENTVYMSSAKSVYRSVDKGANWEQMGASFEGFVRAMFKTNAGTLLVGTSDGIFRGSASTDVTEQPAVNAPALHVHPNPAAMQSMLTIENPTHEAVDVDLLTPSGAVVRRLQSGFTGTRSTMTIDVRDLAAGMYFVRLQAGAHTVQQKLVVER